MAGEGLLQDRLAQRTETPARGENSDEQEMEKKKDRRLNKRQKTLKLTRKREKHKHCRFNAYKIAKLQTALCSDYVDFPYPAALVFQKKQIIINSSFILGSIC